MGKTNETLKPSKNKLADKGAFVLQFGLSEAKTDDSNGPDGKPKHEIVLTALQEGPGNSRDRRWYTREAVVNSEGLFKARRKLFVNHLVEGQTGDDLRNWCATLKETWIETLANGKVARKVRLKIHEEWLWTRCIDAPEEIALSIEGGGAGKEGVIEGESYMVIEKIYALNATKFVNYPGNAKMGADLVEGAVEESLEDIDMKDLTVAMLKEGRADLVAALIAEAVATAQTEAGNLKVKLEEALGKIKIAEAAAPAANAGALKEAIEAATKSFNSTIDELRKNLNESDRKLDAYEVKGRLREKKDLVDAKIKESKLAPEAKTPNLFARCYALAERKEGDKVVTVAEQIDAEIAEQLRLTTSEFGSVRVAEGGAAAAVSELTEDEAQVVFNHKVFHNPLTLEAYREQKKKDAAGTK